MIRRRVTLAFLIVVGVPLIAARPAGAQDVPGYRPTAPTLSPWFNLYQRRGGPLDNYHMFVRPEVELQNTLRQQEATNQRQNAGVTSLGRQVTQMEQERQAPIHPTGTGSVFMSYSHYYPSLGTGHGPHAGAAAHRSWSPKPGSAGASASAGRGF